MMAFLFVAVTARAGVESSDDPPRPPHGVLSSVTPNRKAAAPAPPTKLPQQSADHVDGYTFVGFDQLAGFSFKPPAIEAKASGATDLSSSVMGQVPEGVKNLDGQKVIVAGFMLPVKMENGLATEFLLLNSPLMCCFGVTPAANAWVVVRMPKGAPPVQDIPLRFSGLLHVRAQWDNGWLSSIYQLDGDGVVKPRM